MESSVLKSKRKQPTKENSQSVCNICCQQFTKIKRQPLKCLYCETEVCKECARNIMITRSQSYCYSCKKIWPDEFLIEHFPKTWVNGELSKCQSDVIFDQQKAILPQTQLVVQQEVIHEKMNQLQIQVENYDRQIDNKRRNIRSLERDKNIVTMTFILDNHKQELNEMIIKQEQVLAEIVTLSEEYQIPTNKNISSTCCLNKTCRGFIFHTSAPYMHCGVCFSDFCSSCYEPIKKEQLTEHKCDIELKKTIALIKKDTKPCPKCKEMIYKVSGCDQMFCTDCKTLFSWKTGQVETGIAHNPHYLDWKKSQQDQQDETSLGYSLNELQKFAKQHKQDFLIRLYGCLVHLNNMIEHDIYNEEDYFHQLRRKYLLSKISEEQFKSAINAFKIKQKYIYQEGLIMRMFQNTMNEKIKHMLQTKIKDPNLLQWIKDETFKTNKQLYILARYFNHEEYRFIEDIESDSRYTTDVQCIKDDIRFNENIDMKQIERKQEWMNEDEKKLVQIYEEEQKEGTKQNNNWIIHSYTYDIIPKLIQKNKRVDICSNIIKNILNQRNQQDKYNMINAFFTYELDKTIGDDVFEELYSQSEDQKLYEELSTQLPIYCQSHFQSFEMNYWIVSTIYNLSSYYKRFKDLKKEIEQFLIHISGFLQLNNQYMTEKPTKSKAVYEENREQGMIFKYTPKWNNKQIYYKIRYICNALWNKKEAYEFMKQHKFE